MVIYHVYVLVSRFAPFSLLARLGDTRLQGFPRRNASLKCCFARDASEAKQRGGFCRSVSPETLTPRDETRRVFSEAD